METLFPGAHGAPNLHPMFVHFPIVLWLTALLVWSVAIIRRHDDAWRFGRWLLYLGTLGAAAAVLSGYVATERMGHETPGHDLVHLHRDIMLVASGLAAAATLAAFLLRRATSRRARLTQLALLAAGAAVMIVGADRGAGLVMRYGIGTAGERPPAEHHEHGEHDEHDEHDEGVEHHEDEGVEHHEHDAHDEGSEHASTTHVPAHG